jgi:hypothetical protein
MSNHERSSNLSDAELLAYLDGELDEGTAKLIEESGAYEQRLQALAREQSQMARALYRSSCPEPQQLGEFQFGMLSGGEAEAISAHLTICPHCTAELEQLAGYLSEVAPDLDYTFLERVKVLVARLLPPSGAGESFALGGPALAGVRGSAGEPLFYEAGDVQITLEVQEDAVATAHKSILGLLTGEESEGWQVSLWRDEELVTSTTVDELGNFIFDRVAPATYNLLLRGDDVEIHLQNVVVP